MGTRLAAVAVLIALAALASYAMFSGPTRVPLGGQSNLAPRTSTPAAPPAGEKEPQGEGGGGD